MSPFQVTDSIKSNNNYLYLSLYPHVNRIESSLASQVILKVSLHKTLIKIRLRIHYSEQAANRHNGRRWNVSESSSFYVRVVQSNKLRPHKLGNTNLVKKKKKKLRGKPIN